MNKLWSYQQRRSRGVSLVEFAAALVLGLPLVITILYVTLEASYYFSIRTNIDIAARNAARALAIEYGKDPTIASNPSGPAVQNVLTNIRIPNFVADNGQFTTPTFNATTPASVTISCSYPPNGAGARYGLPPFPNPDPLNLGPNFTVRSTATFATE